MPLHIALRYRAIHQNRQTHASQAPPRPTSKNPIGNRALFTDLRAPFAPQPDIAKKSHSKLFAGKNGMLPAFFQLLPTKSFAVRQRHLPFETAPPDCSGKDSWPSARSRKSSVAI
jgi:hypothetical protein